MLAVLGDIDHEKGAERGDHKARVQTAEEGKAK